ncbi:hypothetical protein KI387_023987 [Taxus chinensis]|uniref:Stomatal closure-related actin-binding protein 1 n=1 Tax=Taxus chinensis TaxID=29808 RepID=A0AA38G4T9_TAXCH|nr:hypothetical protein KI387_023987 [Taxus chinensis]
MQRGGALQAVGADVKFVSNRVGVGVGVAAGVGLATEEHYGGRTRMREEVEREAAQLVEQQKRLSVRDLASKFEKGLAAAAAAKLSDEVSFRDTAALDKQVLLKKLRDVLEALRGRVAGRNKDDVEEAITMVEALTVQLTQREGELLQEKAEVRKLATLFKQASDEARRMVEEARAVAHAEIETARAATLRVEQALTEQENLWKSTEKQDLEETMKEVQEARRIKMLHEPSKVMDMEHELEGLRLQLAEKSAEAVRLRKELAITKRHDQNKEHLYELEGVESLGSYLRIITFADIAPDILNCSIQWYRVSSEGGKKELISGATKAEYSPEPFDVGRFLQAEIHVSNGQKAVVSTSAPIDPAPGLGNYVEALVRKSGAEFNVIALQINGEDVTTQAIHIFLVGKMRIKLRKGRSTKAKEPYSASMLLCGARGGGNAAAQGLFWHAKKGLSFLLAFESERERNAAIMLARRFAFDCNIMLAGPDDRAPLGT